MGSSEHMKDLGRFVYCSGLLEEKVAKAYNHVATLVDDGLIKCLLVFISKDSLKHAESFKAISRWLATDVDSDFEACAEVWGEKWRSLVNDTKRVQRKEKIRPEELGAMIDDLERFEGLVAEEYLTVLHVKLVEVIAKERGIDLSHCKNILEWIIEDEKKHEQILKMIKERMSKK